MKSDLISRQAAIDAFGLSEKTRKYGGDHSGYDTMMLYEIQGVLEDLPSAQPEYTNEMQESDIDETMKLVRDARATILPPAQPDRIRGRWEVTPIYIKCSECGECYLLMPQNFCPNCGADMRERDEHQT